VRPDITSCLHCFLYLLLIICYLDYFNLFYFFCIYWFMSHGVLWLLQCRRAGELTQ
jgi:hypothetical protein